MQLFDRTMWPKSPATIDCSSLAYPVACNLQFYLTYTPPDFIFSLTCLTFSTVPTAFTVCTEKHLSRSGRHRAEPSRKVVRPAALPWERLLW